MATEITEYNNRIGSLLASTARVEAPFIRVKIGGFTFGVYEEKQTGVGNYGFYKNVSTKYPNYIQGMRVKKINGTVNQYTINITYQITSNNDPNFFEKVFGSISQSRLISIDYGDFMLPEYIYRSEEAIITDIQTSFNLNENSINYTILATSTATLTLSGCYSFKSVYAKPSDIIKKVLYGFDYHLTEVFTGMKDSALVEQAGFIAGDDKAVQIPTCTNIGALEYISILVSYMTPVGSSGTSAKKSNVYSLTTYEDTTGVYGGPYFKVQKIHKSSNALNQLCTYEVDIGYPTSNIVTSFQLKNQSNWSIYYNYNAELGNSDYIKRINNKGELEYEFSPLMVGAKYDLNEADKTWWTKVTDFPIQATMTFKGLLRPAILMQYVKINLWFFGNKHIASGYYIITSQEDTIDQSNGYTTTLGLTRVAGDEGYSYDYYTGGNSGNGSNNLSDSSSAGNGNNGLGANSNPNGYSSNLSDGGFAAGERGGYYSGGGQPQQPSQPTDLQNDYNNRFR